jgi:ferredoxin-NADP reductase
MDYKAAILMTEFVTHDVKRFIVTRPDGLNYKPGQGVEIAINQPGWQEEGRPFTPTSLTNDKVLEFTIKGYYDHDGVTKKLHSLNAGDDLLISDSFGTIQHHGPGVFIAGGAGITPFLAIIRQLAQERQLEKYQMLFSNKTPEDVICEKELRYYFNNRCILTCTRESGPACENQRIDKNFLKTHIKEFDQHFYICGPKQFVGSINSALTELGAKPDALVFER